MGWGGECLKGSRGNAKEGGRRERVVEKYGMGCRGIGTSETTVGESPETLYQRETAPGRCGEHSVCGTPPQGPNWTPFSSHWLQTKTSMNSAFEGHHHRTSPLIKWGGEEEEEEGRGRVRGGGGRRKRKMGRRGGKGREEGEAKEMKKRWVVRKGPRSSGLLPPHHAAFPLCRPSFS